MSNQKEAAIILYVREDNIDEEIQQDIDFLITTLGLDPDSKEYKLDYGLVPDEPDEVTVLTSSIFDLMVNLSWQVKRAPAACRRRAGRERHLSIRVKGGSIFDVSYSEDEPENAFVKIQGSRLLVLYRRPRYEN